MTRKVVYQHKTVNKSYSGVGINLNNVVIFAT